MPDTPSLRSALVALYPDNTAGSISPQDLRDFLISALLRNVTTYATNTPTIDDDDVVVLLDGTSNTVVASLPSPSTGYYPHMWVKAINIDNQVDLDPGASNLEGATTDYTFATVNDCIEIQWTGTAWVILNEYLNA
jgi:hypothetical protein